ncbi:tyrosine-type recombinase/integrase [Marixanthomonas sp. SCSIO 43207]|uniref:tyrosine-type recombinase/integrase n=1 Tax=Marixanthomonas sp. SCSIO 43207 TaxID=2779360 RepID=UPI001CA88986|nr:tyrosine-type recombinase/integrase [Marixanthomonas sp. SCSIO 43207]UAB82385.1 tyrosine-type recombinase/integrase [Marixanthomonas sp. SCSIO 43207]
MTGSKYIDYDRASNIGRRLIKREENKNFGLLIICGINLGMRISDLLSLTFDQLKCETFKITEKKTGKLRQLKVNDHIRDALTFFKDDLIYEMGGHAFTSQKGSVFSPQHVNRLLKKNLKGNFSSHSLRKSFGRRVWDNDNQSERSLIYLSELFNHSSTQITRTYLGIKQEELNDIYMSL